MTTEQLSSERMRAAIESLLDPDTLATKDYGMVCCERDDGTGMVALSVPQTEDQDIWFFMMGAGAAIVRTAAGGQALGVLIRGTAGCGHPEHGRPFLLVVTPDRAHEMWELWAGEWRRAGNFATAPGFIDRVVDDVGKIAVNFPAVDNITEVQTILGQIAHEVDYV